MSSRFRLSFSLVLALFPAGLAVGASDKPPVASTLPELGQPADQIADRPTETRLGQAWLRQLRASTPIWQDPLVRDYLARVLYRLALQTTLQAPRFSLVVVDDRSVNAFAVPGGVVGINTGLLLTAESEDEVASVLAHELGHLSQRHFARSQEAGQYSQWIALAGLLASIAGAAAAGPASGNIGLAAGMSAQALSAQNQLRYSRAYEQEADRIGMQTLTQAGYDPRAMPTFFLRMERATSQLGYMPEFLLTHPLSSNRLSDLERRVTELTRRLQPTEPDFALMKTRLQVAYSSQPDELIRSWQTRIEQGDAGITERFGLALALLRSGRLDAAEITLAPLRKADPSRLDYRITQVDILLARRDYAAAWAAALENLQIFPDQISAMDRATRAALAAGKAAEIRPALEAMTRDIGNEPQLWRLLADCAISQKDTLMVFRARAELLYLTNRAKAAEEQLRNALRLARNNYSLTAQLERRIADMRRLDSEFR